jgi:hypothetical protein
MEEGRMEEGSIKKKVGWTDLSVSIWRKKG